MVHEVVRLVIKLAIFIFSVLFLIGVWEAFKNPRIPKK
jgi:hypothetical protein